MNQYAIALAHAFFDRVTSPPAKALIQQSGISTSLPSNGPLVIFDNAGGTGNLSSCLYQEESLKLRSLEVLCGDISPPMIETAVKLLNDFEGAKAEVIDAQVCNKFIVFLVGSNTVTWSGHKIARRRL